MNKDEYAVHFGHVQLIYMSHDQTFGSEKKDNIFTSTLFFQQLMQNRFFKWVLFFRDQQNDWFFMNHLDVYKVDTYTRA